MNSPGDVSRDAWERAQAWAHGQMSHNNTFLTTEADPAHRPQTLAAVEVADAAEVVKWSALAVAAAELERIQHS